MPDFVILSNCPWNSDGRGGNSSQVYAETIMQRGGRVHFADSGGVRLFTPIEQLDLGRNTVVMCNMPWVEYYFDLFFDLMVAGCPSIYRIVDNWHETPRWFYYSEAREIDYIKAADIVVASNPLNADRFRHIRPDIGLLRNGVDLANFWHWQGEPPTDLKKGEITAAFVTSLWAPEWIDWEALFYAVESCPELVINVLARIENFPARPVPDNMNLIGIRPWKMLPAYLHHCDVGLLPYLPAKTRHSNPLKALEYLGCGVPVVCLPNPSLTDYPYHFIYDGPADFVDKIRQAAATEVDRAALYNFLQQHTWEARLDSLLLRLGGYLGAEK